MAFFRTKKFLYNIITNADGIEYGSHYSEKKYSTQMIEKGSIRHKVASIQNYGR